MRHPAPLLLMLLLTLTACNLKADPAPRAAPVATATATARPVPTVTPYFPALIIPTTMTAPPADNLRTDWSFQPAIIEDIHAVDDAGGAKPVQRHPRHHRVMNGGMNMAVIGHGTS